MKDEGEGGGGEEKEDEKRKETVARIYSADGFSHEEISVSICLLPGGESVLRSGVPGAALVQGFGAGASHLSHGRVHVGRPVGRDHDMRVGRDALVSRPRPPQRHPLAHIGLPISPARAQPGARRALSQTVQTVQGQQETLPGAGQGGEDTEAGLWSNVRDGRRHTCRRTAVDTVAWQVSIDISLYTFSFFIRPLSLAKKKFNANFPNRIDALLFRKISTDPGERSDVDEKLVLAIVVGAVGIGWANLTRGVQAEGDLRRDALALHQSLSVRGLAGMGGHAREHQRRVPSDDTGRGIEHLHLLDQDQVAQGTQA